MDRENWKAAVNSLAVTREILTGLSKFMDSVERNTYEGAVAAVD